MKNICIFLSGNRPDIKYEEPAKECAVLLAQAGFDLLWGGTALGLMDTVSGIFKENGRKLIGVTTERLKGHSRTDADEMIVTKDILERKKVLIARADAFVVLVGGIGTLDEVGDVLESQKSGIMNKPIIILNTDGFFDGLKIQLERIEAEHLLPKPLQEIVMFAKTPEEVIKYLNTYSK